MKKIKLCIIGATGLVGETFLKILTEQQFVASKIYLYSSAKSAGKIVKINDRSFEVKKLTKKFAKKVDFTFFFTSENITKKYLPLCTNGFVIDNSPAFRLNKNIPLIIPEINGEILTKNTKVISNPNCVTSICATALNQIIKHNQVQSVQINTYQSLSGMGKIGIKCIEDNSVSQLTFGCNICDNCYCKIGDICKNNYTIEEMKIVKETKKIFKKHNLKVSATCIRVPVKNCHCAVVKIKLKNNFNLNVIKKRLKESNTLVYCDNNNLPINQTAQGKNKIFVSRLRRDICEKNSIIFWVIGDNLRRGASYNAFKIMERLINYDRM